MPHQTYNLNKVQVILGQDCYAIHHHFEFKKSKDKTAPSTVKSKICWPLNEGLQVKQAATITTTATSIADDKLANQRVSGGILSPTPQSAMSPVIKKTNNEQSKRWSKQCD